MILAALIGVLGLFCLYCEFFLPGGVLAVLGGSILLGSIVLFFLNTTSPFLGVLYVLLLLGLAVAICFYALRNIRRSGKQNAFFLQRDQSGFSAEKIEENLIGKEGIVSTELKPSGHIRIEGKIYQALSQGEFLPKGSLVEVLLMKGSHVIVKLKK